MTIRIAIVYPASAALPKPARIRTRPIQLAVPIKDWKIAAPEIFRSASMVFGSSTRCSRRIVMRPVPRASVTSWRTTARPRPVVVATAAPVTPSAGNGPRPKMRHGSRTRLQTFANHRTRIATVASPAPRKIALMRNRRTMTTFPPSITAMNPEPEATTSGPAPMNARRRGARSAPATPSGTARRTPRAIACTAVRAALSRSRSPMRRATMAVAAIERPIASE